MQVIVISAHRSGRGGSEVHVGNVFYELESFRWRRKAKAARVAVVVEFGDLDVHVNELSNYGWNMVVTGVSLYERASVVELARGLLPWHRRRRQQNYLRHRR